MANRCVILLKCLIILSYILSPAQTQSRSRDRDQRFRNDFRHHDVPTNQNARQMVDPCHSNYHRMIKNEPRRSYNYRFGSSGPREHALCDRDLIPGWYRFHSLAGDTLPTSCPGTNYCGTRAPVWMKGTIPSVDDGIAKATACVSVQGKCCTTQIPILVRNCTDFIVYHLQPTPACPSAYCAGYEVPCPTGLSSESGYTPCHFPVDLLETKVSYGLSKDNTQINFFCDVTLGGKVVPDTVALEVEWLADDEVIQSETFGLLQQHKGVLKEEKWTIGQTLQCRARAKHTTINTFTSPLMSEPLNTGVLVLSSPNLSVTEGSDPIYVEFQTTIPIVCPKKEKPKKTEKSKEKKEEEVQEEEEDCCITFEVNTRISSSNAPRCASGNAFDLVVTNTCSYKVCADEWNSTHKIPIWAVNDGLFGGDVDPNEIHAPVVAVEIRTAEASPPRWQDITLPSQEVTIQQADVSETCISNQYLVTFDGIRYENNFEGTFVLYKHSTLPYEVQIHRKKCTHAALCNCAVAVRFGEVMIAADICTTGKMRFWSYTVDGNYIEPAKITHLPQIIRLDEGRSFQIQFPTGTRLVMGHNLRFVMIQASMSDLEHTSGLCGSFDRDPSNEFSTYKGQVVCQASTNRTNSCADFAKSWRLLTEQSLFVGSFTNDGHTDEDETHLEDSISPGHCSCSGLKKSSELELRPKSKPAYASPYEDYQPETEQTEEEAEAANKCVTSPCVDPRGVDITTQFIDLLSEEDFIYEGEEFGTEATTSQLQPIFYGQSKLDLALDTKSEITEDAAEVFCRGVIEGMPVTKLCRDVANINVELHIKSCKDEVMYTKTTIWTLDALEELRMDCKYQIYHNLSTWEPQLGRQHGTPPLSILSSLCLNNCSAAGVCEHGVCRCRKSFSGADCSVDLSQSPKITSLGFKNTCDIRNKACSEVIVWGERFADEDSIKCHIEIYRTQTVKAVPTLASTLTTNGKLLTYQSIVCDIPELPIHDAKIASFYIPGEGLEKTRALLRIRVRYGSGSSASDPLDYTIYDSLCWACETPLNCEARPTQSCNVLSEPFGSSSDPFQSLPAFSNPSVGFAQSNSPLQYSPDSSSGLSIPGNFNNGGQYNNGGQFNNPEAYSNPGQYNNQGNFNNAGNYNNPSNYNNVPLGQPHPGLTRLRTQTSPCSAPSDTGPCRNDILRYFFDASTRKCRPFIYGGCQGNQNNFLTEQDCQKSCDAEFSIDSPSSGNSSIIPHEGSSSTIPFTQQLTLSGGQVDKLKQIPELCLLGNSPGPCAEEVVRYYFDTVMQKCRPFIYGGCLGNENNFDIKDSCRKKCEIT